MKQTRPVQGRNLTEFSEALNEAYAELSRFKVERTEHISSLEALIFYDIPDELMEQDPDYGPKADYDIEFPDASGGSDWVTIRLKVGKNQTRHCCECDNYSWGRGCPYRSEHIKLMDPACKMFNVIIEGRF